MPCLNHDARCVRSLRGCFGAAVIVASLAALPSGFAAEPLALSWQGSFYMEGGRDGSWIQRQVEERFGLRLHCGFFPAFSYDKQLMFSLMGGEGPDVFWVRDVKEAKKAAEQGFALELPWETIALHAPMLMRQINKHAAEAWLLSYWQGKNFGLPNFNLTYSRYPSPGVWNKTWLTRVGIDHVPETLDEMEEALRRFRERDPDGNGRRDTYGMCHRYFEEIFAAFGVIPTQWTLRDGHMAWGATLPESRRALALLRRWYADGLILPDFQALPPGNNEVRKYLFNGQVGYVAFWRMGDHYNFNPDYPVSFVHLHKGVHPDEELTPGKFPIGPGGQRGGLAWPGTLGGITMFNARLRRRPEAVVRVLQMFDALARDQDLAIELRIGRRGLHWDWDERRGFRKLPPYDDKAVSGRELLGEQMLDIGTNFAYFVPFSADESVVARFLTPAVRAHLDTFQRIEWGRTDALVQAEVVPSAGKLFPDLRRIQETVFNEIIIGKRPLEAFDAFVAEWLLRGGDVLTREANEMFVTKQALLARVTTLAAQAPP